MDHTVVHFEIPADQPERAVKFYKELFGWDITKYEGDVGMEYWMVQTVPTGEDGRPTRPGVNGGLMRRMFPGQAPVNYIAVESVDEFVRKAEKLGAKLLVGKQPVPSMGWFAQFTDPEGNMFAIWENDPNAGPAGVAGAEQAGQSRR
jgi:predicted enzyme related to lactoylglutathione lyase